MQIFNRRNTMNTGNLAMLTSWMLIGPRNSAAQGISIQVSEIPVGSEQPVHRHAPEQCYYIIRGRGLMTIEDESAEMQAGDAVHIPSNKQHGIRNIGEGVLEYLTANSPMFDEQYERKLWPAAPVGKT
jgi:mannose-6-phosphate isomerase-like protein (cupin superfamily)